MQLEKTNCFEIQPNDGINVPRVIFHDKKIKWIFNYSNVS